MLSTTFALIALVAALVSGGAAFLCARDTLQLVAALDEVERARRALKVASDRLSLVEGRIDRLTGRVYAQARKPRTDDPAPAQSDIDDPPVGGSDRSYAGPDQLDPDLAAEIALAAAPSAAPGRGR